MSLWIPIGFCVAVLNCVLIVAGGPTPPTIPPVPSLPLTTLVGAAECLDGPSYWCQNFTTAKECNANRHCIRTVWEHQQLPPDNGEICTICIDEVTQARDMLKSNETQENLKLVLEGSCLIMIPVKIIARECVKLMDQAIPELIEALSSEMDPQVVCHTAGLCNSPRMDSLIAAHKATVAKPILDCDSCTAVAGMAESNFRAASRDHVLNSMLEVCGRMGSFSDGCSAALIVHFNRLYESLASQLHPGGVCHLAGVCQQKYHNHSKVAEVKTVPELKGDVPCELCEQLVQHLRDILVANTTEKEFEQVLLGLCQATKAYKKECVDMVETYYPAVYAFLTEELDGKVVCVQIGICPKSSTSVTPLYPLVPVQVSQSLEKDSSGLHRVPLSSAGVSVHSGSHGLQVGEAQLPLDSLVVTWPHDKQLCQMCEYFLHFVQIEMTSPVNEQAIINRALATCNGLPDTFAPTCRSFVETYGAAVLALLAQDIDPSQVCPKIAVCPGFSNSAVRCEPCKASTFQLITKIGSNTSEANIHAELMTLCLSLPYEQSRHCSRVVAAHHEDLVDMVTAEFTSDEMCFFMKYCSAQPSVVPVGGDIETNEIPMTWEDEVKDSDICVLCEFVLKTLEKDLQDNKTEAEIRVAVEHVCVVMPATVRRKCRAFVDQYIDLIVTLLAQSVDPKQICQAMNVCPGFVGLEYVRKTVNKCIACESMIGAMQGVMEDTDVERDLNRQLRLACLRLPNALKRECYDIVVQLAPQIEAILGELPLSPLVCQRLHLCAHSQSVDLVAADKCSEGQDYWCLSTTHAAACQKIEHCQKNVWLADKPNKKGEVHVKKFLF